MGERRGSIAFFATYRPPVPLDIYWSSLTGEELHLTDGVSYNYNCRHIAAAALKTLIQRGKLASEGGATAADIDAGNVSGLIFVSEREHGLETLQVALRFKDRRGTKVFSLADIFGANKFGGVRMEDSGCVAGGFQAGRHTVDYSFIYVSTKEPVSERRSPWTAVYKTNLRTGETERLTPKGVSDLSPAVSPSGKMVAVASFQRNGWQGEIEDLQTEITLMNVDRQKQGSLGRTRLPIKGGWPSWGSDDAIFFHRKDDQGYWGVYRYKISTRVTIRVTPAGMDAVTPAAINESWVAVATIREKSGFSDVRRVEQYRHIEIFSCVSAPSQQQTVMNITRMSRPKADHFNPFCTWVPDGGRSNLRIGYHRCRSDILCQQNGVPRNFYKLSSPLKDVGLFRVSGVFPTISKDGSKLAFVDNEFKDVWLADKHGLRVVYKTTGPDNIFYPVWNQNPEKDILYVCVGPSFNAGMQLNICAIFNVSRGSQTRHQLTKGCFNNAFPSTNPEGTRLVFRSTRGFKNDNPNKYKNLYIMENADDGEYRQGRLTRLTCGPWTDTHCQWSPNGDWIVFSSTRDKPRNAPKLDQNLDPGYFAVYLVSASDPNVVVRVIKSGNDLAGHVNHPVFSPDGRSIAVTADLAAVSVDPISLPLFVHSVRPYGDVFVVDIDPNNITKNKDVKNFHRITHSRYENSTPAWTIFATSDPNAQWSMFIRDGPAAAMPACPYIHPDGGEGWHMTGHLCIPKRCC
ncbi:hypothetical protein QOZ80_9AG0677600 [Eleusine coracana subsp. coracana]|nr:hypothetical protein QOZ80_9AG0677600 [Eleusine coracana subsp. coracana]